MDRQSLIDKMEQCRKFADEALADAWQLPLPPAEPKRAEIITLAEQALDYIDELLNCLNGDD